MKVWILYYDYKVFSVHASEESAKAELIQQQTLDSTGYFYISDWEVKP